MVENNMILQKNGSFAPPSKQATVIFIDDLNLSKISPEYDVQSPAEIIRDYANYFGWYSKTNQRFYYFNNLSFVGNYSYVQSFSDNGTEQFNWVPGFHEKIYRHMLPIRMEALSQN